MNRKPIIGLVPLVDIERDSWWMLPGYMEGVMENGGLPVMLPVTSDEDLIRQMAEMCDGFIFTGGHDVDPAMYGEEKRPVCAQVCPQRDGMEPLLYRLALEADKPILGICRGLQFINVMQGGTLWQDIPTEMITDVTHRMQAPYDVRCHDVTIAQGTPLNELLGTELLAVNSCHHQGIKVLGNDLSVMATAPDGLVESFWMPGKRFVWATQWHPEFSLHADKNSQAIFSAFIRAAEA